MPQPTASQVHVNAPLTNVSIAYMQSASNFVWHQAFPIVPVNKKSDVFFTFAKEDFLRDSATLRAPGSPARRDGFDVNTDSSYTCKRYDIAIPISDDVRDNADAPLDLDMSASEFGIQKLMIRAERLWAASNFVTSVWGTTVTGNSNFTYWDSDASGDPISDVSTGRKTVLTATGTLPNTLIVGFAVHEALKKHPLIKEIYKYTTSDSITTEMLARVFEVDRYLVSSAVYDSSEEGASSPTYTTACARNALLCYVNPQPALMKPSAGYTFAWKKFAGNDKGIRVKKWRDENSEADVVETAMCIDPKLVASDLGYFFLTCTSA